MQAFYSWQTDSPNTTNKAFIRRALEKAANDAANQIKIGDAPRSEDIEIKIEQDTQGVLGSPHVAETIFSKIKASDLFIADVTFAHLGERKHINSNVAIEIGFALAEISDERVLLVMNTHFGKPAELPFDLRFRRWPIQYALSPDASKKERASVLKGLSDKIAQVFSLYLLNGTQRHGNAKHAPLKHTFMKSAFWGREQWERDERGFSFRYPPEGTKALSIRAIPNNEQTVLTALECKDFSKRALPFTERPQHFYAVDNRGAIVFYGDSLKSEIYAGTKIFRNREIWAFSTDIIPRNGDVYPTFSADVVMKTLPDAISNLKEVANEIIHGDYSVAVLASGLTSTKILEPGRETAMPILCTQDTVELKRNSADIVDTKEFSHEFVRLVYAEANLEIK